MTFTPSDAIVELGSTPPFDPFLLNPRNIDVLQGRTRYLADLRVNWTVEALISSTANIVAVPLIIILGTMFISEFVQLTFYTLAFLSVSTLCIVVALRGLRLWTSVRLSREGRIFQGELRGIDLKSGQDGDYSVTASQSFLSPSGNTVEGKNSVITSHPNP